MTYINKYETAWFAAIAAILLIALFGTRGAEAMVTTNLGLGSSGSDVTELQSYLAQDASIYPEGLVTGYYGGLTEAAVQRFQCRQGIVCSGDAASTGYGRVGPMTLARLQSLASAPGIPNTGSADEAAPIMTDSNVTVTATTATISWTTSEPSENGVLYGLSWPFYLGNAPSAWSPTFSDYSVVVLKNLIPGHTYYFVRQSVDGSGNVQYDLGKTFTTLGQ